MVSFLSLFPSFFILLFSERSTLTLLSLSKKNEREMGNGKWEMGGERRGEGWEGWVSLENSYQ